MTSRLLFCLQLAVLCLAIAAPTIAQTADPTPATAVADEEAGTPSDAALPPLPAPAPAEPSQATASGLDGPERLAEAKGAVSQGVSTVATQSARMWDQVLLPMWQRFATALPILMKAVLLLLAFWLAGILLGALAKKLLLLTKIDDRAVEDWGLDGMLTREDGTKRSLASLAGMAVRWTLVLFGFVAFFQALELHLVATPLQNVADSLIGVIPNLLEAAVILLVYWIVATLARTALIKVLELVRFDVRAKRYFGTREVDGEDVGPSKLLGRLAFYLVLLFGLPPFLAALGQTALVDPLTGMFGKALGFIPNFVAALILFFVGKLVATIVREVVTNFLAASGIDRGADGLGLQRALGTRKISDLSGTLIYFFILISIVVAAVDTLGITAISEPVQSTLQQILAAVPLVFVALVITVIGYALARAVGEMVQTFLGGIGFDQYPDRFGLSFLATGEGRPTLSVLAGRLVTIVILLLTAEQALATLQLDQLSGMVGTLIAYLPNLFAGVAIMVIAVVVSGVAARLLTDTLGETSQARIAVPVARYAILFLGISMGLSQLGVGEEIVNLVVAATLFGAALAFGLAFGMGGRDRAQALIDETGR